MQRQGYNNTHYWKNLKVEVSARGLWKYLGLVASIDVTVDDKRVLATGGKRKMADTEIVEFEHDGSMHKMKLSWSVETDHHARSGWYLQPFHYQLVIDGVYIGRSTIEYNYWKHWAVVSLIVGAAQLLYLFIYIYFKGVWGK